MNKKKNRNFYGWLAAAALVFTASCSNDSDFTKGGALTDESGETAFITFTVIPDVKNYGSRADAADELINISHAQFIDKFIYAVYLLDKDSQTYKIVEKFGSDDNPFNEDSIPAGQNILKLTRDEINAKTITVKGVERGKTYRIVCWAQSSQSKAYNTADLSKIAVSYENAVNNDEFRDAFTASEEIYVQNEGNDRKIILKRPFAQINVGTTGYDYEGVAALKPAPVSYTKSKVTLKGAATCFDAVKSKAVVNTEYPLTENITFAMSTIPAFINLEEEELSTLGFRAYDTAKRYIEKIEDNDTVWTAAYDADKEHFLHVNFQKATDGYMSWDQYLGHKRNDDGFSPDSIIFANRDLKYLSMCYVLVPEATDLRNQAVSYGSVLDYFKCELEGIDPETKEPIEDIFNFELYNVPVQRNWRTNITSRSLFLVYSTFYLTIVPDYCGDYNNMRGSTEDDWQNVTFDTSDEYNWKLEEGSTGNPNGDFRDPGNDYHGADDTTSGDPRD